MFIKGNLSYPSYLLFQKKGTVVLFQVVKQLELMLLESPSAEAGPSSADPP